MVPLLLLVEFLVPTNADYLQWVYYPIGTDIGGEFYFRYRIVEASKLCPANSPCGKTPF